MIVEHSSYPMFRHVQTNPCDRLIGSMWWVGGTTCPFSQRVGEQPSETFGSVGLGRNHLLVEGSLPEFKYVQVKCRNAIFAHGCVFSLKWRVGSIPFCQWILVCLF